ncbi:MAG: Hsp70 family protein, partial [Pseudohongiellaceae bacterium]
MQYDSNTGPFAATRTPGQQSGMAAGSFGIGIDFGTTNSAAAVFDGQHVTLVSLEKDQVIMASASYIDRDLQTCTGQEAIDTYIAMNQGRKVELSAEVLGEARTSTGQVDPDTRLPTAADTHLVYGQSFVDASLPGRLFRGTKRLLGNAGIQRILVFDRPFRLVALITPILLRIRQSVESTLQRLTGSKDTQAMAAHACIGHPVNFEGRQTNHNQLAMQRLAEAYEYAGITSQGFYPEPTAAALSYLFQQPRDQSNVVLTVDFGGGTLDLCILQRREEYFDVAAIHGVALGGDHLDQCLFRKLLFPLLG